MAAGARNYNSRHAPQGPLIGTPLPPRRAAFISSEGRDGRPGGRDAAVAGGRHLPRAPVPALGAEPPGSPRPPAQPGDSAGAARAARGALGARRRDAGLRRAGEGTGRGWGVRGAHTGRYRAITGAVSPQLIDYAKRGDTDERAMRMANFWLTVGTPFIPFPSLCPSSPSCPPRSLLSPPQSQS